MLHGRAAELAQVEKLLTSGRSGDSSMLVIFGEAGSGKTASLDHIAAHAKDYRVIRCTGVESEAELPFAGLHLLLHEWMDRLDTLPEPQAKALYAAFGLAQAPGVDRFLTGLATLTLLSEVAADVPLLGLIDDAQWLDRASFDALLFAGRRLGAEGVVLILAARENGATAYFRGLPILRLPPLSQSAAAALLAERAADLAPGLRDRLIEDAKGNPLALIELAAARRTGEPPAIGPPAVTEGLSAASRRVLDTFGAQLDDLPSDTRLALLVVAVDDTGELGLVLAAASQIDVGLTDFAPAECARMVRLTSQSITFRHPLIQSALYARSSVVERLAVHRVLAEALTGPEHADRRAWHLAAAAAGYDDDAATAMAAAAERAVLRGGYAASAAAMEGAARLTADPVLRGQRLAAAAMNCRDSAQLDRAAALAEEASTLTEDPTTLAHLAWVKARVEFERGTPRRGSEMVLDGAVIVYDTDPEEAARMLIETVRMAYFADEAPHLRRAIDLIEALPLPGDHALRPMLEATSILAKLLSGWAEDQVAPLPPAVHQIRPDRLGMTIGNLSIHSAFLRMVVGDADEALAQTHRMLAEARARGLIGGLPHILLQHAQAALVASQLQEPADVAGPHRTALWRVAAPRAPSIRCARTAA